MCNKKSSMSFYTNFCFRIFLRFAKECDGVVVSNDNFRDIIPVEPDLKSVIKNNLLMYTFVDDVLIFPNDPLGSSGPSLKNFLVHK